MFRLNIQRMTINEQGRERKLNVCTRCMRTLYKGGRTA